MNKTKIRLALSLCLLSLFPDTTISLSLSEAKEEGPGSSVPFRFALSFFLAVELLP